MPELVLTVLELRKRHAEIPVAEDCYLVDAWGGGYKEGEVPKDHEGFYGIYPVFHHQVDPLGGARDFDEETWEYQYGGKGGFRMGQGSPTLSHPVYLKFRWGEGHPLVDGVQMLIHSKSRTYPLDWCNICGKTMPVGPQDCAVLRLKALAIAVESEDSKAISSHLKAVELWHQDTLDKRWATMEAEEEAREKAWRNDDDDDDDDDDDEKMSDEYRNFTDVCSTIKSALPADHPGRDNLNSLLTSAPFQPPEMEGKKLWSPLNALCNEWLEDESPPTTPWKVTMIETLMGKALEPNGR